ncbi:PREDICTED: peptide chain release factor 1, mitochondrial isoform X1 [Crocodylus porosus]|uniref:peptide chain release factor 1, mitochondrial isoform X1 n=3 Tax=Crocodylus porosus TaxID=8502 RepID=UPI00093E125D|nr:PREDICTED: peptide chain release factor 1, mitochondrial isoform X1 [Crocodylus porosus]
MKPHQGIWLFRRSLAIFPYHHHCCASPLVKKIGQMMERYSVKNNYFLNTVKSTLPHHAWPRKYHQDSRAMWKHEAVQKYLETAIREYQRISHVLSSGSMNEHEERILSRRHADLVPLAAAFQEIQKAEKEVKELESMCTELDNKDEKQLLKLAFEEKKIIDQEINTLYKKLLQILMPKRKHDECDVILELISGRTTGGDICQMFTKEVFEMYQNYAAHKSWTFEILNYVPTDLGGLHHATACISGGSVYRYLKFEGGTHRVQRIPEIGLSSRMQRIHTGTMSVVVLPQSEKVEVKVNPKDLHIDTFRAKGAGGQHVNKTDSAVRIVHLPTGLTVECQQERSQQLNKEKALQTLRTKLYQQIIERNQSQMQNARKLQLETRAQSERIRTYNFTQDRVTDHRISYEVRNIKEFLLGEEALDELINRLLESAEMEALIKHVENFKSFEGGG